MDMSSDCVPEMQKIASCLWALACIQGSAQKPAVRPLEQRLLISTLTKLIAHVAVFHERKPCVF